jgi:hypothetical protein
VKWSHCLLCVSLWLLGPALALAQQEPAATGAPAAPPAHQMYEDIEIMRRLLLREMHSRRMSECASCHEPQLRAAAFTPDGRVLVTAPASGIAGGSGGVGMLGAAGGPIRLWDVQTGRRLTPDGHDIVHPPTVEGVYLKGYGVVYSLTLPPQPLVGGWILPNSPAKPVSDWDRIRGQVRGQESPGQSSGGQARAPRLDEVLLKLLADNGHHFSQLAPNERLTVAITFRGNEKDTVAAGHAGSSTSMKPKPLFERSVGPALGGSGPGMSSKAPTSARDYELLGDLQFKRARYDQAIAAYQRALEMKPQPPELRSLYLKLGAGYLRLSGSDGNAAERKALARALDSVLLEQGKLSARSQPGRGALPYAQLVISAPKSLLDRVGGGGITFGDFRQQATVEFRRLAPGEKNAAP